VFFFSQCYRHATSPPKTRTEAAAAKTAEKFNRLQRAPTACIGPKKAPDDNHAICRGPDKLKFIIRQNSDSQASHHTSSVTMLCGNLTSMYVLKMTPVTSL